MWCDSRLTSKRLGSNISGAKSLMWDLWALFTLEKYIWIKQGRRNKFCGIPVQYSTVHLQTIYNPTVKYKCLYRELSLFKIRLVVITMPSNRSTFAPTALGQSKWHIVLLVPYDNVIVILIISNFTWKEHFLHDKYFQAVLVHTCQCC